MSSAESSRHVKDQTWCAHAREKVGKSKVRLEYIKHAYITVTLIRAAVDSPLWMMNGDYWSILSIMKAVLFGLKSRVAKHFGLISMHNVENAASFAAAGVLQPRVRIGMLLMDRPVQLACGKFQFLCKRFPREPQLEFIAHTAVAQEMASLLERQLRPAGEACVPLVSSFKCWQVEMQEGAGAINKRLCLPPSLERRVYVSQFPGLQDLAVFVFAWTI